MALITNTGTRYDAYRSVREDLANVIYNISPTDTPFMSNIGKDKAKNTFSEWQTDSLASPDTSNAHVEGDDVSGTTDVLNYTNRVGNYAQISRKLVSTSGTVEALDKAGMRSLLAYQMAKKSSELKRDMEAILTSDQVAVIGNDTTARKTAGLGAWIITNFQQTAASTTGTPAAPIMSSGSDGYPATGPVDHSVNGAFVEADLKTMIQNAWTQGAHIDSCFVMGDASQKKAISAFTGIATRYRDTPAGKQASIVGAADIYVSDFGTVNVVPNRFMPANRVDLVNPEYAAVAYLRNFRTEVLAKTGDAEKRMLLVEYMLKIRAEKAFATCRACS